MSERRGEVRRRAIKARAAFELPELLTEIADVAGLSAALAIAQVRGGTRTHFPAWAPDDHWLVAAVGREAADKLCEHFRVNHKGGVGLTVPLGPTRLYDRARFRARELIASGRSISETAREIGVSTRSVETWNAQYYAWLAARGGSAEQRKTKSVVLDREYAPVADGLVRRLHSDGHAVDPQPATGPGRNRPSLPDVDLSECPALLGEIARVAGLGPAVVLGLMKGSRVVHITDHAGCAGELRSLVGAESADRIARHFAAKHGGEIELLLPVIPPIVVRTVLDWIVAMRDGGHAASDLAEWLGVTPAIIEHMRAVGRKAGGARPFHHGFPFAEGPSDPGCMVSPEKEP